MDGERAILDPFNGGKQLDAHHLRALLKSLGGEGEELLPEHSTPLGNIDILLRLQNNIKVRLLVAGQAEDAITTLESMILLAPDRAEFWREAGILHAHTENFRAALISLENALELAGTETLRQETAGLIQKIRGQLN